MPRADASSPAVLRTATAYALMLLAAVGGFLLIRAYGEKLAAPLADAAETAAGPAGAAAQILPRILLALAAVMIGGQILAWLFARVGQPPVIGEVVVGILLGPSLFGAETSALILPPGISPHLGVIAQLGVILYMFIVGLELNGELLKQRAHSTVVISHASIVCPFLLGAVLALWLYPRMAPRDVPFTSFALFMGVAMSITAFPVLARILTDRGLSRTELGVMALGCAAIDDATAWCLLAFVVGVAQAQVGEGLLVAAGTIAYIAIMFLLVRPLAGRLAAKWNWDEAPRAAVASVFILLLLAALAAEGIGIHAIFGAFLLGAVIPHDSTLARSFSRQLEPVVTVLLLPAFFAVTGMRTRIDLLGGAEHWLICGLIILVATLGKFGGALAAGRVTGLNWRDAAALGTLMNTRGLMQLVVLDIGLDLGVISPTLFAMMVLMALATTMATSPMLRWLYRG